jgi:hypothetical protein
LSLSSSSDGRRPYHWFQCDYCGKIFSTRFYLDLHMSRRHHGPGADDKREAATASHERMEATTDPERQQLGSSPPTYSSGEPNEADGTPWICPAADWCRLVGLANCHERALREEPYYDRGSGGWGDEDKIPIQHRWRKVAQSIPCSTGTLQEDCRSILRACGLIMAEEEERLGEPTTANDDDDWTKGGVPPSHRAPHSRLAEQFCQRLTCPRHRTLLPFFFDENKAETSEYGHPYAFMFHHDDERNDHRWKDIWTEEFHHHRRLFSLVGVIVVVGLFLWVLRAVVPLAAAAPPDHGRRRGGWWGWWLMQPVMRRGDDIPAGQRLLHNKGIRRRSAGGSFMQRPRRGGAAGSALKQD